jgi:hypothetical protein
VKRALAAVVLTGCVSHGFAARDWILNGTLVAESLVDAGQTKYIIRDDREINPFVGSHGQGMNPWLFGALSLALEMGVAYALPPDWRLGWESFWVGAEGLNVYDNAIQGYTPWGGPR